MDPQGLKRFNKRQTCSVGGRIVTRYRNFGERRGGGRGGDGRDGTFANTLRAVNSRRIDRADTVRNINVNGRNMRPRSGSRNSIHVLTLLRPGCHRRPELRGPRLTPRVPLPPPSSQLHSVSSVPLIHRAHVSPYPSESRRPGNPKLCAAATRGHLNQCLSNWVKSFQSMLINFISVYLSRYARLGAEFCEPNEKRDYLG